MKKTTLTILVLVLALQSSNYAQNRKNSDIIHNSDAKSMTQYDSIEKKINILIKENNIPSLSIGIINNGEIELLKGFGVQKRGTHLNVNEHSIFQIASQSKMFTGIIVNNLIQEKKLNINESIINYFPESIDNKTKERLKSVKLRNVLNHTSGIPSNALSVYKNRKEGGYWLKGYSRDELIADLNKVELEFEPGSKFIYSNSGYGIIGFVCENVSDMNYQNLVKKYVTEKYDLKNTETTLNEIQKTMLVTPYRKDDRLIETKASIMGMATPASAIYSNVTDLSKLMLIQLKAYQKYKANSISDMLVLTKTVSQMNKNLEYGFGLIKGRDGEKIKYGHGGDADGFACEYFFIPNEGKGIVILTSSGGRWIGKLAEDILNMLK